jgi:uncharacterized membrane protein
MGIPLAHGLVMNDAPVSGRPPDALYRLAAAGLGGMLLGLSADRRTGAILRVLGLGLIAFAAEPLLAQGVQTAGDKRRRVSFKSMLDIERPVADVFAFFKNFENFAHVTTGIRSVIDYEDGRSRWEVTTPSGRTLTWNAVVTKYVPNSVIAWESVPHSDVETTGLVRFTPLSPGRTRLELAITYRPTRTDLADAVHSLLAPRNTRRLRADLEQARHYIESLPAADEPATSNQQPATSN